MASDIIHRILRSLTGNAEPQAISPSRAVDRLVVEPPPVVQHDRRIDTRFAIRTRCAYELVDGLDQQSHYFPGEAYSLNLSADGILLLLDRKPQDRQLVAMRNPAVRQRDLTLFEVRWMTALPAGTNPSRYMVGCHLTFGRIPYFLIQRQYLDRHISGLSL